MVTGMGDETITGHTGPLLQRTAILLRYSGSAPHSASIDTKIDAFGGKKCLPVF